ncbi:MAG TPA: type II toxin-antitoxin system VapC family toxin [Acidimicrobiales bacterium]|nr:type II toxin-antitoxin system VapC family toxin [Acidimicrobiales bacterium]
MGILDTDALILLPDLDRAELPAKVRITSITLAELSLGPLIAPDEAERARRQVHLQQTEAAYEPLAFDTGAARAFAGVAASLRRAERKTEARAFDALIAATAIANRLPLFTCNPDDFRGIDGLMLRPVSHPTRSR